MEILFFLCGLLAITPICLLAMNDRRPHTLHVHHWHHQERPQTPQGLVQARYQVITGSRSAHVQDTYTGATYAILEPTHSKLLTGGK